MIGLVIICHGFGEHLGWYDEIGMLLAANGFLAFGHDHLGKWTNYIDNLVLSIKAHMEHITTSSLFLMKLEIKGFVVYFTTNPYMEA